MPRRELDKNGLWDVFQYYPYKKQGGNRRYWVRKKDRVEDHDWSLDYGAWKKIVVCYLKYLVLYLLAGNRYRFSSGLGELEVRKYKLQINRSLDYGKMIEYYMEKEGFETRKEAQDHMRSLEHPVKFFHKGGVIPGGWRFKMIWSKAGYYMRWKGIWILRCSRESFWKPAKDFFNSRPDMVNYLTEDKWTRYL